MELVKKSVSAMTAQGKSMQEILALAVQKCLELETQSKSFYAETIQILKGLTGMEHTAKLRERTQRQFDIDRGKELSKKVLIYVRKRLKK